MRVEPRPTPEEAAALVSALEALRSEPRRGARSSENRRSRWRLAGLFGHAVPPGMEREGSLWRCSSWEGKP